MSSPVPSPSSAEPPISGVRAALNQYTGIPVRFLRVPRLRLPSRNWLVFLSVVGSVTSLYVYDRRECKRIRREYCDRVSYLSEAPLGSMDYVRCVRVIAAKHPGDDEPTKGMKYFRKYVKPILVAAALDFDMIVGQRHGNIARLIAREAQDKRLVDAGLAPPPPGLPTPGNTPQDMERRALEGGVLLVGRSSFKEYMEGLRRGWCEPLVAGRLRGEDAEEDALAKELEVDGVFDEPEVPFSDDPTLDGSPSSPQSSLSAPDRPFKSHFLPDGLKLRAQTPSPSPSPSQSHILPPVSALPPQPPLLVLPFTNLVGMKLVPLQIWGFFNRRHYAQSGAEYALILIDAFTRPLAKDDLTVCATAEKYYPTAFEETPARIQKAREEYYKKLPGRLATARDLARGEREPTKAEEKAPPPTEVELRAERFEREKRWREQESAWRMLRPESEVAWDDAFEGRLRVYCKEEEST